MAMFIGHFAVGLAAKKFAPRTSLGLLLAAPMLADLLWPIFLLLGFEQVKIEPGNTLVTPLNFVSYPYSHSLLTLVGWATLFAGGCFLTTHYRAGAVCIWFGVVSHWICDAIVHRPDMPLYPGGTMSVGLGLWNSRAATLAVEAPLFLAGLVLYQSTTRPADRVGRDAYAVFVVLIALMYVAALAGTPPPSVAALAYVGLGAWLFLPWAGWFDRHRALRHDSAAV